MNALWLGKTRKIKAAGVHMVQGNGAELSVNEKIVRNLPDKSSIDFMVHAEIVLLRSELGSQFALFSRKINGNDFAG